MKAVATFGVISAAIIAVAGAALAAMFGGPDAHHALLVSAVVAWAAQVVAFATAWRLRGWHVMGAWGLGAMIRFVVLVLYALIGVKQLALAPTPALIGVVTFFFLTTLAEPWLFRSFDPHPRSPAPSP